MHQEAFEPCSNFCWENCVKGITADNKRTACCTSNSCDSRDGEEKVISHDDLFLFVPALLSLLYFTTSSNSLYFTTNSNNTACCTLTVVTVRIERMMQLATWPISLTVYPSCFKDHWSIWLTNSVEVIVDNTGNCSTHNQSKRKSK